MSSHHGNWPWLLSLALSVAVAGNPILAQLRNPQPRSIELDAATMAVRAEAARQLVPLLQDVKRRATGEFNVTTGGAPDSPFTGTQTTLFSVTIGKRQTTVDPQVVQAMDQLLKWRAGDRSAEREAALFDDWLDRLSRKATALSLQTSGGACDTECVVRTMTQLNETWGESPRTRGELRDQALLEALTDAVKAQP